MKARIQFNQQTNEYIIKILKTNWWWLLLLLLLLLPLLLLIKCNKTVNVTVSSKEELKVEGARVYLAYYERHLFDFNSKRFFVKKLIQRNTASNKDGIASFPLVQYTLFQQLFFGSEQTSILGFKECLSSDSLRPTFSALKAYPPFPLLLKARNYDFDFMVIDKKTQQSLVNAKVQISLVTDGKNLSYTETTDATGKAFFINKLPLCKALTIKASCQGYHDTTFTISNSSALVGELERRIIPLRPVVPVLMVIVKNKDTGSPLPLADVKLMDANGRVIETRLTNTGGHGGLIPGSATFSDLPDETIVKICASKTYFKSNCIEGKAGVIKRASESGRTIFLEPEAATLTLKVVNEEDQQPIAGAEVKLTADNKTYSGVTADDGTVTFAGIQNESLVSAVASRLGFYQNNHHINQAKVSDLLADQGNKKTIPLRKFPPPLEPPSNIPRLDCNVPISVTAGNYLGSRTKIDLVNTSGTFVLWYDMQKIPDELVITCEQTGEVIFKTRGRVSGVATHTINYSGCRYVIVTVTQQEKKGTAWKYKITCP